MTGEHPAAGYTVEVHPSIASIAPADWDRCNGSGHPLTSHAYLRVLEESGAVGEATGFRPRHVLLRDPAGHPVAAAPAYLKTHSIGEVGADFGFRLSHERSVGPYFPKLQVEVPLTPVAGSRLLVANGEDREAWLRHLLDALIGLAQAEGVATFQIAFMKRDEQEAARAAGMLGGRDFQFVWRNHGFGSFNDFLATLKNDRRGMIRRERRDAIADDLSIEWLTGNAVSEPLCRELAAMFASTFRKYETDNWYPEAYFVQLFQAIGHRVFVAVASTKDAGVLGAALFVSSARELIGLQWGASHARRFLMLETTIYQGMERAIADGLPVFSLGSLGHHKAPRGVLPEDVYHAYWFRDPAFREIAATAIAARLRGLDREKEKEMARNPFRSPPSSPADAS